MTSLPNDARSNWRGVVERSLAGGEPGAAVLCLLERLRAHPSDCSAAFVESCFPPALSLFCEQLSEGAQADRAEWLWRTAIELTSPRPLSALLRSLYARYLFTRARYVDALEHFELCAQADPRLRAVVYESIENLKSIIVDRWHFSMLNDTVRNSCYENSIVRAVEAFRHRHEGRGPVVLDIGGGTGLLSMFAARAGAESVYCCELSPSLCNIAGRCVQGNGYGGRITVVAKHSRDVIVGIDMASKADIIVTELMDAGLFGEHIIPTLNDARERLLTVGGVVIPHNATVFGVFVECPEIRFRQTVVPPQKSGWDGMRRDGVDFLPLAMAAFHVLSLCDYAPRNSTGVLRRFVVDESYTCEKMVLLRERVRELSPVLKLGDVMLSGDHATKPCIPLGPVSFRTTCTGRMDALVYWFDLCTEDTGEQCIPETSFTTAPADVDAGILKRSLGWEQAVLFLESDGNEENGFLTVEEGRTVTCGVGLNSEQNLLCVEFRDNVAPSDGVHLASCSEKINMTEAQAGMGSIPEVIHLGEMDISMLNDWNRTERYLSAVLRLIPRGPRGGDRGCLCLVELTGNWLSFASVVMHVLHHAAVCYGLGVTPPVPADLKLHEILDTFHAVSSLISCPSVESVSTIEKELWRLRRAPSPRDNFLCDGIVTECGLNELLDVENGKLPVGFNKLCEHGSAAILICDIVEGSGLVRQGVLRDFNSSMRLLSACIAPKRVQVVPDSIGVVVGLLQWEDLFDNNFVKADATNGINVHTEINRYGSTMLRELDMRQVGVRGSSTSGPLFLDAPQQVLSLSLSSLVGSREEGLMDTVLQRVPVVLRAETTGVVHAISMWFELYLVPGAAIGSTDVICTGPTRYCGADSGHYRQAAFLLNTPLEVVAGQEIELEVTIDAISGVYCCVSQAVSR